MRFAVAKELRRDNPAPPPLPAPAKQRRPVRRWANLPRREALPERYRPHFDFLREVWGRYPELTWEDLESIEVPGRVPEMVEITKGKGRGQYIALSLRAQRALQKLGGSIHRRVPQREFKKAFKGEFDPTDLKELPPVGFGVELHAVFEGEVRDLLMGGDPESAARKAFVMVEDRLRSLSGRDDLSGRNLADHAFSENGPFAKALPERRRENLGMLLSGLLGLVRNVVHHRDFRFPDEAYGLEVILVIDFAMRWLDEVEEKLT